MMRRPTVIVFARAAQFGAVKTRLADDVGRLTAWRFQRNQTARLVRRLAADRRWRLLLALTPDTLASRARFSAPATGRMAQGSGDLGERMVVAFNRILPGPVVIVGSDIPAVTPARIATAFKALAGSDVVFGPAEDGGYWLIGLRGRRVPARLFRNVRWSTEWVLADTLRNLRDDRPIALADTLSDVDTGADYREFRKSA